ncbi:MAG: hypothetical protein RIQ79_2136 [Verrucomicrobiota bacterium]|jgi:hypothetical protein
MTLTDTLAFFSEHPEHSDGVRRANLAYHANHREAGAHYFSGSCREAPCRWCGQTREGVRWDWYGESPTCGARPGWADEDVERVVAREEKLFEKVLDRAKKLANEIDVATLTGEKLARLHHTHGVDPSMLEVALMEAGRSLPQQLHDDYQRTYAEHRATGKRGLVREIIVAKTL